MRGYAYVSSQSGELRRQGIKLLRRVAQSDPEALEAIRNMLEDPDAKVRDDALETLADLGDRESLPRILNLLSDADADIREEAIETVENLLEDVGPEGAADLQMAAGALVERLSDPDPDVRGTAADTLGDLRIREAVPVLVKSLSDPDEGVRGEAIVSLGEIGDPSAIPYMRALYGQGAGEQTLDLVIALKRLGDEQPFRQEAARLSQTAVSGASVRERVEAVRLLGRHGGDAYRSIVQQALNDESPRVREEAQDILEDLGR